eukprot:TRINITY_DN22364_c0_g1_i1.p1 TRINITY_DN22364_c0_g1~~TRINITY_DN22364_c0_g1_i1.p1  ORF type:complete len:371 (+),score=94.76 TRINITY_DN22364_c0_g1_i1:29-1141(+)
MARLTTMPSRSVTLVLIMLILSVYILQQNSDILDKLLVHRIGKVNNFSNPPNLRHILNKDISRKSFWKRTQDLRRKIDAVAAMHGKAIRKPLSRNIQHVIQSRSIVYNRIDKAGSTTLIKTLDKMAFKNSFHLIGHGTPNVRYFFPVQKAKLASMLCDSSEENLIYTRHMYYTDMAEMGCNVSYFNMMRDPVDRFVSRYNYYREVWEATKDPHIKAQGADRSANINDCVLKNHPECLYSGELTRWLRFFRMDSQIPYFCGDSLECRTLGSPQALDQAKKHVEEKFVMVGTIDSLSKSHSVMECLMPDQMQGLAEMHKKGDLHVHSEHKKVVPLSDEAREVMEERMKPEYDLYKFVQDRLDMQYEECTNEN